MIQQLSGAWLIRSDSPDKAENPDVKPSDNPFHKYSKVKKLILEPSRLEMDKLSAERKIDFSFTYEDKKNDGRLKGNPTHIEFVIVPGPLGIEREQQKQRHAQEQSLISSYSQHWPDVNAYDLSQLLKEVPDEWWEEFKDYAYDGIEKAVEKKQPDHVAEYIVTLLSTWIKDKQLEDERKRIEQEKQYNLFTEQELQPEPDPLEPGVKAELWQQLVNEHQGAIKPVLERTEYLGLYNGAFYIFPSIKKFGMSSNDFAERLLREKKVAVVPGTAFGDSGEGFIRISYAYSLEKLKLAMEKMEAFINRIKK